MKSNSKLTRNKDQKVFAVTRLGHWSDIQAEDGETDSVKWYGGSSREMLYVSATKGFSYVYKPLTEDA